MLNILWIIGKYKMLLNSNFYKATLNYNTDGYTMTFFYCNPVSLQNMYTSWKVDILSLSKNFDIGIGQ